MLKQPLIWLLALLSALAAITAGGYLSQEKLFEHSKDFPEILHLIDQAYVDEVDMDNLMPGVFQGAIEKLDENASYIPPGITPLAMGPTVFERTGLTLSKYKGYAFVLGVAEGSPADAAGIKCGQYLSRIGENSTRRMSLYQIRAEIARARAPMKLALISRNHPDEKEIELTPGSFLPQKLRILSYGDGVHLLQIHWFYEGLEKDLKKALSEMAKDIEKRDGRLVLDLRNNTHGTEADLLLLASFFLPAGKLASWVGAHEQSVSILNPKKGAFSHWPLFILIDQSTSLAAEAFSAIAQDQKVASVVGFTSLGYPDHYKLIPLKSGGHLELSTQKLQLSSGAAFTRSGVKPDLELTEPFESHSREDILDQALTRVRGAELKKAS